MDGLESVSIIIFMFIVNLNNATLIEDSTKLY